MDDQLLEHCITTPSVPKPVLMGMAPGQNTSPHHPLFPYPKRSSGWRMWQITGMSATQYLRNFERTNVLTEFPGKEKGRKGDKFPIRLAKQAAKIHKFYLKQRTVVFVGRQVAEAFGFSKSDLEFWDWSRDPVWGYRCTVMPHTSGANRYWNDEKHIEHARKFLNDLVQKEPCPPF